MNTHQRLLYQIAKTSYDAISVHGTWFNSFDKHYQIIRRAYGSEEDEYLRKALKHYQHCANIAHQIKGLE